MRYAISGLLVTLIGIEVYSVQKHTDPKLKLMCTIAAVNYALHLGGQIVLIQEGR